MNASFVFYREDMDKTDKQVSCEMARERFVTRTNEQLKTSLRCYETEEYLDPSNWSFFDDVTPQDAAELVERHKEIIRDILESRGIAL